MELSSVFGLGLQGGVYSRPKGGPRFSCSQSHPVCFVFKFVSRFGRSGVDCSVPVFVPAVSNAPYCFFLDL